MPVYDIPVAKASSAAKPKAQSTLEAFTAPKSKLKPKAKRKAESDNSDFEVLTRPQAAKKAAKPKAKKFESDFEEEDS
jgi:hypothetical protein